MFILSSISSGNILKIYLIDQISELKVLKNINGFGEIFSN